MPVLPSSSYVSIESVTNLIRAIANDMIYSQAGEILTDNANFMFPLLNDSLEWFQNEMNNHGVTTFEKETFLLAVTPSAFTPANDSGQQVNISDTGYFDGTLSHVAPQIPVDLLVPLKLWERQTGANEGWVQMRSIPDGLPSKAPSSRFGMWEWRQDALYIPRAKQENDLRLRYTGSHAILVTPMDTLYFRGATGTMAYKTVAAYLASKNPQAAQMADGEAKLRLGQLTLRTSRENQRTRYSRRAYGSSRGGPRFRPPANP